MKILFVGELSDYARGFQRFQALRALGHDMTGISYLPAGWRPGIDKESIVARVLWRLGLPSDTAGVNGVIRAAVKKETYDIVWIEKGNTIRPATLRTVRTALPRAKLVSCSEDDMYARHNRSCYYVRGLPYYDIVFTTKTYNLEELKQLGARRTALFIDAFAPALHRPRTLSAGERERFAADVGFIGTFEDDRAEKMLYLAQNGIRVVVWGNGWGAWRDRHPNLMVRDEPLYGEEYVAAINATKINLGFLRKRNRDETTSRSVEIPACGAFLLAERTVRHQALFAEGKEAEFFGDEKELLEKVRRYLADEQACTRIAAAGRERCLQSGYDHEGQLGMMIRRTMEADVASQSRIRGV